MTTGCYGSKSQAIINIKLLLRWVQKQLQQYYVNIFDFDQLQLFRLEWSMPLPLHILKFGYREASKIQLRNNR